MIPFVHFPKPLFCFQFETLSFNTDNNVFLTTMDGVIDGLAEFFASLPDVSLKGGSQELDAIESLLELGQRLEILILKLEVRFFIIVDQRRI